MDNFENLLNSTTPNYTVLSLILLAFFIVCFIFVVKGNKNELKKKQMIQELLDSDPTLRVEYRYFIDINRSDYVFDQKDIRHSYFAIAFYFLVFFILVDVISTILVGIYCDKTGLTKDFLLNNTDAYKLMSNTLTPYLELIVYLTATIGVVIFCKDVLIADIKRFKKQDFKSSLWGILFLYGGSIIGTILLAIAGVQQDSSNEQAITDMISGSSNNASLIIICVVTILLAPIVEELVFRKAMFNVCKNNTRLAIVVSSLLFGFIHVSSSTTEALINILTGGSFNDVLFEFSFIIVYALMGVGLALTYVKGRRNVISSIITHMINNAFSMLITILSVKGILDILE